MAHSPDSLHLRCASPDDQVERLVGSPRPAQKGCTVNDLILWFRAQVPSAQRGQGLAEYALILALIAVIAIAALVFLGTKISTILSTISVKL